MNSILIVTIFISMIETLLGFQIIKNIDPKYSDYIVGESAFYGQNKQGEWYLMWIVLIIGCLLVFTLNLLFLKKYAIHKKDLQKKPFRKTDAGLENKQNKYNFYAFFIWIPFLINSIIYGKISLMMFLFSFVVFVLSLFFKEKTKELLPVFLGIYFSVEVVSVIFSVFFRRYWLGDKKVFFIAIILFASYLFLFKKQKNTSLILYGCQFFLPFLYLAYLKNDYAYGGSTFRYDFPRRYVFIICLIIVFLILLNVFQIYKGKKVLFASVISIFSFVSYMPPALIMPSDMHHHGEQILCFQQIIELGQKAYVEYSPASGFFPMIIGTIMKYIFHGEINAYNMSYVLFAFIFEFIIMTLLYRRIGGEWAIFIACIIHMPVYCRTWIFMPVLLILTNQKLLNKRFYWFFHYVLLCFLSGLYYPLFGGALLIGFLPVFLVEIKRFINEKEYKTKVRWFDWIAFFILIAVIIPTIPLLYRMFLHISSMGGQTLDADGMAIIGGEVSPLFMPLLKDTKLFLPIYYCFRFLSGLIPVWIFVYLISTVFIKNRACKERKEEGLVRFSLLTSIPIIVLISYTYTMVCLDESWVSNFLSRSSHVLLFLISIGGFVVIKEIGRNYIKESQKYLLLSLFLSIPFVFFNQNKNYGFPYLDGSTDQDSFVIGEYQTKLLPYELKEDYVLLTDEVKNANPKVDYSRIGNGFASVSIIEKVNNYENIIEFLRNYDPEIKVLGYEESQLYYYLLNEKTVYSGRTAIALSKDAVEHMIDQIDFKHTAVRQGVVPMIQYYMYREFVKAGYVYCYDCDMFIPGELFERIYMVEGNNDGSIWTESYDVNKLASSYGKSIDSMKTIKESDYEENYGVSYFADSDGTFGMEIGFEEEIDGFKNDFLYLKLENIKAGKLYVSSDCSTILCDVEDGNLLIPLGINANWLNGSHDKLRLKFEGSEIQGTKIDDITINELKFYHLDELNFR